jgi:hypothetical protein
VDTQLRTVGAAFVDNLHWRRPLSLLDDEQERGSTPLLSLRAASALS